MKPIDRCILKEGSTQTAQMAQYSSGPANTLSNCSYLLRSAKTADNTILEAKLSIEDGKHI